MSGWKQALAVLMAVVGAACAQGGGGGTGGGCPPQEAILPCRCLLRGLEFQIWCSHSDLPRVLEGLKAVGQYIFQPIDELILENNYLPSLPGRAFHPLRVMRLMLRHNGLERVSGDWLAGLEASLMELFVVEPDLRSLPEDSLIQLNDLEAVTIQTNLMKRLPMFFRLPKLRYLQIESLSLIELLPRNFKDLPSLEKFHISGSPRLTKLETGLLDDLPLLKLVNISYCGLNWISPRALSQLPMLRELSLVGNKITDAGMVGRGSRDLGNLQIIRLDSNLIDRLAEASFVDMPALKHLFLLNNRITEIHHGAFHRVPALKIVDLTNNIVRRVHPESFLQPSGSGLEELWLVNNDIGHVAELRSLLDTLPKLTFLDMSHNYLEAVPFGALRGHATLERLHLDHNKIHLIDPESFMAMPALRELRLRNNSLSDILGGPLWNLPSLKGLDLSANLYRRLESRLLDNLPSLRKLDMSGNELTIVEPTALLMVPELEHVNMSFNALNNVHPSTFRHLLNLYELDLSHNRLVEFVPGLPRGIEYLHLSYNQMDSIPLQPTPDLDLPSLRMLDLSNNGIQTVPPGCFKTMPQLRKLHIRRNIIHRLEDRSFEGMMRLEVLDLQDNRIANVNPKAFTEMIELREINLRSNRLDILVPDLFKTTHHLKKLDVSRNLLAEILPGTLDHLHDLVSMDVSNNVLVQLPPGFQNLKKLKYLNLVNNRLKNISPDVLSNLASLTELRVSRNFIQDLKKGAFDSLQHLQSLQLDRNEIEVIEPYAFRLLPALKLLKLDNNKLLTIPTHAFSNLPSLQMTELQDNQITKLARNAFHIVPHLVFLNLSNNHLTTLDDAGLSGLRPLEVLDVGNNRISRVEAASLERLEWLVELRMDDNQICSVRGSPFSGMPRLRVLSLRNNKMMSFPEQALQNLRGNIAVLDIEGNPLACTCALLWLKGWLQETGAAGPRCLDGTPVRDLPLERRECPRGGGGGGAGADLVSPGCEAELLSAPSLYDTSQVFTPWMRLQANGTLRPGAVHQAAAGGKGGQQAGVAPSPEESDYFYDEYVDYPYNETLVLENDVLTAGDVKEHKADTAAEAAAGHPQQQKQQQLKVATTSRSHHYVTGDTPTIYAASRNKTKPNIPKEVVNSPSTSGFTFFGVPLPSINFSNLWDGGGRIGANTNINTPPPQVAERKTAIMNKPSRSTPRAHILPSMMPPSTPEIQTGGFIPILPGSGGFKPIPNPMTHMTDHPAVKNDQLNKTNTSASTERNIATEGSPSNAAVTAVPRSTQVPTTTQASGHSMGHPIPTPSLPTTSPTTAQPKPPSEPTTTEKAKVHNDVRVAENSHTDNKKTETTVEVIKADVKDLTEMIHSNNSQQVVPTISTTITLATEESARNIGHTKENLSVKNIISVNTASSFITQTTPTPEPALSTAPSPKQNATEGKLAAGGLEKNAATPLSALLVPGGQQPQFRPAGRPTITKVPSPYASNTAPLHSQIEPGQESLSHSLETRTSTEGAVVTEPGADINTQDTNWYFANYNKTNIEPFVGGTHLNSAGGGKSGRGGGSGVGLVAVAVGMLLFAVFT